MTEGCGGLRRVVAGCKALVGQLRAVEDRGTLSSSGGVLGRALAYVRVAEIQIREARQLQDGVDDAVVQVRLVAVA